MIKQHLLRDAVANFNWGEKEQRSVKDPSLRWHQGRGSSLFPYSSLFLGEVPGEGQLVVPRSWCSQENIVILVQL